MCVGTSVGTITEPDCLGPCEPGTSVTLEGIVWHETEGGTRHPYTPRGWSLPSVHLERVLTVVCLYRCSCGECHMEREDLRWDFTRLYQA